MYLFNTIAPVFAVIFLGWLARRKGHLSSAFLEPANRLVYYLAIPAMIFRAVSKGSLKAQFDIRVLAIALVSILLVWGVAWSLCVFLRLDRRKQGTFMQSTFHGNLGYIGLAVAYYALGTDGFVRASILAGFIMILQNFLAVVVLQIYADEVSARGDIRTVAGRILGNPVIVSALLGILFSVLDLSMPVVADRSLGILSGLALPMALLIIGASLSFDLLHRDVVGVLLITVMKLLLLPGVGFILFGMFNVTAGQFIPGLILLASPSATLTYIMAREMNGDPDLAVAAISVTTLLSAVTFVVWLNVAG